MYIDKKKKKIADRKRCSLVDKNFCGQFSLIRNNLFVVCGHF